MVKCKYEKYLLFHILNMSSMRHRYLVFLFGDMMTLFHVFRTKLNIVIIYLIPKIISIWMITQWIGKFTRSNNKITKQDEVQICCKVLFSRTKGVSGQPQSLGIRGCYSDSFGDGFLEAGHFVVSRICTAMISVTFGTYHTAQRVNCSAYWSHGGPCIKSICRHRKYSGINGR